MIRQILPFLFIAPSFAYAIISIYCARAFFNRTKEQSDHTPPVTILKPVKGMDADSYEKFASFCCQDYPEVSDHLRSSRLGSDPSFRS